MAGLMYKCTRKSDAHLLCALRSRLLVVTKEWIECMIRRMIAQIHSMLDHVFAGMVVLVSDVQEHVRMSAVADLNRRPAPMQEFQNSNFEADLSVHLFLFSLQRWSVAAVTSIPYLQHR